MGGTKLFWNSRKSYLMLLLGLLLLLFGRPCWAAEDQSVQHYKMLSSVEYSGQGQFKNQVETLLTVREQLLSGDKVRYFISSRDFSLLKDNLDAEQQDSSGELSFIVDGKTGYISGGGSDLGFYEKINNHCVSSLKKVTKDNIGKTWKQSFDMPFLNHLFSGSLNFTLTAIKLKTEAFGDVIAVRALSEPFVFKSSTAEGNVKDVKSKIGAVYLFDPEIEDIYLSISVFEATTSGSKEKLRHEVGTYMTDSAGTSVNLSGLGKEFEKFVQKVGLEQKGLKVVKETPLPQWAQYEGLTAGQVAHICAATACEGAPNPVATVCIPTVQTVALQSHGTLHSISMLGTGTVSSALVSNVAGIGAMKIAAGPLLMGISPMTAGLVGGGGAAVAAGAGGGGGGGSSRSPSS